MKKDTSWEQSAQWYDNLLSGAADTYHQAVVLPNLVRLMRIRKNDTVLDIGCGQGFFAGEFAAAGAKVIGIDKSAKLIELARKNQPKNSLGKIEYQAGEAGNLKFIRDKSVDLITIIFAIQNIENPSAVLKECRSTLKDHGRIFIVMNHPAFRIPKGSGWGYDEKQKVQYRRIDKYMTESKEKIEMRPFESKKAVLSPEDYTISFHRPLQYYFKLISNSGLAVARLEEWISHKKSQNGPRQAAEDTARKEFPLFLCLEIIKNDITGTNEQR